MSPVMVTSDVHRYPAGWGWRGSGCVLLAQAESSPILRSSSSPAPMLVQEKRQFLHHRSVLCTQKEGSTLKGQTFNSLMRPCGKCRRQDGYAVSSPPHPHPPTHSWRYLLVRVVDFCGFFFFPFKLFLFLCLNS